MRKEDHNYLCQRRSLVNSGWKAVASIFPWRTATATWYSTLVVVSLSEVWAIYTLPVECCKMLVEAYSPEGVVAGSVLILVVAVALQIRFLTSSNALLWGSASTVPSILTPAPA